MQSTLVHGIEWLAHYPPSMSGSQVRSLLDLLSLVCDYPRAEQFPHAMNNTTRVENIVIIPNSLSNFPVVFIL